MHPRLAERARHSVAAGFAAATIELPGIRGPVGYSGGVTAIGLRKTLHANMGGHTGVPWFEGDAGNRFFARHLG